MSTPKDISSLYNMPMSNFNELRINNYNTFKTSVSTCTNLELLPKISKKIYPKHNKEYPSIEEWSRLSINVLSRLSLNFYIIYDIKKDKDDNIIIFYEKLNFTKINIDNAIKLKIDFVDEIIFQKILIGYTLYNLGYTSYNYYYDIYEVPPTPIVFKINDLYFIFTIKKLVMLSLEKTHIINTRILENEHLNIVLKNIENNTLGTDFLYIKFLIVNFIKYLDKKMFPSTPFQLSFETEQINIKNIQKGNIVKFNNNNIYNYGILIDFLDGECEIWYFSENKNKKDYIVKINKSLYEIYKSENIIFIPFHYSIGKIFN